MQNRINLTRHSVMAILFLVITLHLSAQTALETRLERLKKVEGKLIFPLIKGGLLCGVIPADGINIKPDPKKEVKLIFDFAQATSKGNQGLKINEGLEEVARILNLHIAAGVKKDKLKATIVFHAGSILTIFTNDYYQQKYQSNNPNLEILDQLMAAGVELVVCGQSLGLREVPNEWLLPKIKIALSAKTTLTQYDNDGYYGFEINAE